MMRLIACAWVVLAMGGASAYYHREPPREHLCFYAWGFPKHQSCLVGPYWGI